MGIPVVQTPRGVILLNRGGQKAYLRWNKQFSPRWDSKYRRAQYFHDKIVLAECEPFTPKRTGALILSGKLGTVLGTGLIKWTAFYAAHQYFMPRFIMAGVQRGPYWFERMKAVTGRKLIDSTIKIFLRSR